MMKIGEKIKCLRKQKNLSQEVLANYLGVSFQAVSKWESGTTMPDVMLIPAIASFFGVSTDELFDFNLLEMEQQIDAICDEAYRCRDADAAKAEKILWEGLRRYPGNDRILNNLLYTMDYRTRTEEVITLCKSLMETTRDDAVKYDVVTHSEVLEKDLKVMDSTAASLCRDNNIPILVFNLENPENIVKAVLGENIGTIVKEG